MYEYNGRPITLEQIQSAAQKSNLSVEEYITKTFLELNKLSTKDLIAQRMDKYSKMGEYKE